MPFRALLLPCFWAGPASEWTSGSGSGSPGWSPLVPPHGPHGIPAPASSEHRLRSIATKKNERAKSTLSPKATMHNDYDVRLFAFVPLIPFCAASFFISKIDKPLTATPCPNPLYLCSNMLYNQVLLPLMQENKGQANRTKGRITLEEPLLLCMYFHLHPQSSACLLSLFGKAGAVEYHTAVVQTRRWPVVTRPFPSLGHGPGLAGPRPVLAWSFLRPPFPLPFRPPSGMCVMVRCVRLFTDKGWRSRTANLERPKR